MLPLTRFSTYLTKPLLNSLPFCFHTHKNLYYFGRILFLSFSQNYQLTFSRRFHQLRHCCRDYQKYSFYPSTQNKENGLIKIKLLPTSKLIKSLSKSRALMPVSFQSSMSTKVIIWMLEKPSLTLMLMPQNLNLPQHLKPTQNLNKLPSLKHQSLSKQ